MAARYENLYSRFVAWAKIILPLAGLAILSSLFLFSKTRDIGQGVRLINGTQAEFGSKEQITGPRVAGMTPSGAAIVLSAKEASPRANGAFDATRLSAHIELPNGGTIQVHAKAGMVDSLRRIAVLSGGITLATSGGYTVKTRGMRFVLDKVDVQSDGKIIATGPLGTITAGNLHLTAEPADKGKKTKGYLLVFKQGVKLVYNPNK